MYIPKVVDKTNDFWKALILGTRMAAQEYNAVIEIKAPSEENDVERQNALLKEAIEEESRCDPDITIQFYRIQQTVGRSERKRNQDQLY